jgi:hypothetical protein
MKALVVLVNQVKKTRTKERMMTLLRDHSESMKKMRSKSISTSIDAPKIKSVRYSPYSATITNHLRRIFGLKKMDKAPSSHQIP